MKIKHIIILAFIGFTVSSFTIDNLKVTPKIKIVRASDDYCDGWKDGYKDGWCYGKGIGCLPPLVPLCPLRELGEPDTYKAGYQRGFNQGQYDNR